MPIYLDALPLHLREQLTVLPAKVNVFVSADHIWRQLSAAERARLVDAAHNARRTGRGRQPDRSSDLHLCYRRLGQTTGMWMSLHGYDRETAVIDLGYRLNFLSQADHDWLKQLLNASPDPPTPKPFWDSDRRQLRLGDRIVRNVRGNRADAIITVLEEFEAAGWPADIPNPVPKRSVAETARSLNRGADGIRFHGRKGYIWWEPLV